MKWRCALIQKWLPAYLDGDLPSFWRARLGAHLQSCPACREDLAGLGAVVQALKTAPSLDPGPGFWESFDRELHVKLAQSTPASQPSRIAKLPYYLLGAPALAMLLFWVFTHLGQPHKPLVTAMVSPEQVVYVGMEDGAWQGEEFPSWDIDAVMADLTHQEREVVLQKVRY